MELTMVPAEKIQKAVNWLTNTLNKICKAIALIAHKIVDSVYKSLRFINPRVYALTHHKKRRIAKKSRRRLMHEFFKWRAMVKA